jgi:hypothetical protein
MATDQMQVTTASIPKYEALFEQQLRRAVGRVRFLDVMAALLTLAAGTLLYALLVIGLDRWLILSGGARQFALIFYLIVAAAFVGYCIVRPFLRTVNPYYAAKRLERTIPEAKNSVVNWLDLRDLELPGAIRSAVGQRAAHDAARADMDAAISGRRAAWAGGWTGALFVALLVTLGIMGPSQFWSLLGRAFGPFSAGGIRTRTQIELRQPQGDAVVPVGNSVAFAAVITGKVPAANRPDAPRLLFRYRQADPYEERPLELERESDYATTLPANQVHGGFWYKIAAGDAETEEYQVRVRATALIEKIDVEYHYREYLGWKNQIVSDPNISAVRGTEVVVTAHANRPVRTAQCNIFGKEDYKLTVPGELVPGTANVVQFKFTLERDGFYRIAFTSTDGESYPEHVPYSIEALPDRPPNVKLTKPGADVTLPANGLLQLEGSADDDLGVASMTLRMQVVGKGMLEPKPYRGGKSFKLADGGYPKMLEYKDAVELDKLKDEQGRPVAVTPKLVIEYWLEAADACDFPKPNIGESDRFRVTIGEPDKDQKKQQEQRQQAAKDQQNHEQKQDQDLDKENKQNQEKQNQDGGKNGDPQQGGNPKQPQQGNQEKPDPKTGETQNRLDKQFQDKDEHNKSESKSDDGRQEQQPPAGKGKDKGEPEKKSDQGSGHDGKQEPGQDKAEGAKEDGKGGEKSDVKQPAGKTGQRNQSETKDGPGEGQPNPADQKEPPPQQGAKPDKSNAKDGGPKGTQPDAAQPKDQGASKDGQESKQGEGKGPGKLEKPDKPIPKSDTKPDNQQPPPGAQPDQSTGQAGSDPKKGPKPERPQNNGQGSANTSKTEGDPNKQGSAGASAQDGKPDYPMKKPDGGAGRGDPKKSEQNPTPKPGSESSGQKPGEKVTKEDVARLAEQMQTGDAKQQQDAAKQLAQVARNAKDEKAREDARKALEQGDRDTQTGQPNPASSKEGPKKEGQQPPQGQESSETKGLPKKQDAQVSEAKSDDGKQQGEKSQRKGDRKSTGDGTDQDTDQPKQSDADSPPKGKTQEKPDNSDGGTPGGGGPNNNVRGNQTPPMAGTKPDERDQIKKGELLLERFDKMLEKEKKKFLEDAKISEEDMKRFREDIKHRKKRLEERTEKAPKATGPGSRTDAAATQVKSDAKSRAADSQYGGRGAPPPEFRETYREFTSGKDKK